MSVMGILASAKQIIYSDLIPITLPDTKSEIVKRNGNVVYCSVYKGLRGLFRKDVQETKAFGRRVCDRVSAAMSNRGFFTTDELPNYGLSKTDRETILARMNADREDDLVLIFAYGREEARASMRMCEDFIREARYTWIYKP